MSFEQTFQIAVTLFSVGSALHALLSKTEPRAALGWMVACLAIPGFGALAYCVFGINYIQTRGRWIARIWPDPPRPRYDLSEEVLLQEEYPESLPSDLRELSRIADMVTRHPLLAGNRVEALHNGEQAYPRMLDAIGSAQQSVLLATYIFETNPTGRKFVDALAEAERRGIEVKVLVDGIGEKYAWPRVSRLLRKQGVEVARFLPPSLRHPGLHMNLRNHRKLLVVDGRLGFTGGMNIGGRHMVQNPENRHVTEDLHFEVAGPVVGQFEHAFWEDWCFATRTKPPKKAAEIPPVEGDAWCRGISDGPNEDFNKLSWILAGGLTAANREVRIMTPYFIPDRELIVAINTAALRGVVVEIILPEYSNLRFVDWATRAMIWELLMIGVRVYLRPKPFAHSKLLVIDDCYCQVGSANLDPRSLRLNFEYNLEIYDPKLAREMIDHFESVQDKCRPLTLAEIDTRSLLVRTRDSVARLFSPYL